MNYAASNKKIYRNLWSTSKRFVVSLSCFYSLSHFSCFRPQSIVRALEQGSKKADEPEVPQVEEKIFTDDELVALIDPILTTDDISRDGYIDYPEFIRAQQKSSNNNQQQQQQNN